MPIRRVLDSALAGFTATVPMSFWMETALRLAAPTAASPLPPRQITRAVGLRARLWDQLNETEKQAVTLVSHFAFGAAAGAAYGALFHRPARWPGRGMLFGLGVWSSFYLGLLPATGLRSSIRQDPAWYTLIMILAHLAWGQAVSQGIGEQRADSPLRFIAKEKPLHNARPANARAR